MREERLRDIAYRTLERFDEEQALVPPASDREVPRRGYYFKDDRRSSSQLTERERAERWPLG